MRSELAATGAGWGSNAALGLSPRGCANVLRLPAVAGFPVFGKDHALVTRGFNSMASSAFRSLSSALAQNLADQNADLAQVLSAFSARVAFFSNALIIERACGQA
jgi:hypothetical protein